MKYLITNSSSAYNLKDINIISPEEAESIISRERLICEDTETTTLDWFKKDPLLLVQIGTIRDQFAYDIKSGVDLGGLKRVLENKSIEKILVNGVFESNMLKSLGIRLKGLFDISIAVQVLRQGRKPRYVDVNGESFYIYSLAGMYKEYLDINIDKKQQKSFIGHSGIFKEEQLNYAFKDVELFDLYDKIVERLIKKDLINYGYDLSRDVKSLIKDNQYYVTILEMKFTEFLADMLYNGIHINKNKWSELYNNNIVRRRKVEKHLNTIVVEKLKDFKNYYTEPLVETTIKQESLFGDAIEETKKSKNYKRRINWNSHLQVKKIIKSELGKIPKDKKGSETIGIKELFKVEQTPLIKLFIKYKKYSKLIDSYGIKFFRHIDSRDKRIHFKVNQLLVTGRIAPHSPNLAQIPKEQEWRNCFDAQEGYVMVGGDYSAQESRIMADLSKDVEFLKFFNAGGGDSHSMVSSKVMSKKYGRIVEVSSTLLRVEHLNDTSREFINKWLLLYPNASYRFDSKYLILEGDEDNKCPLRQSGKILNFFISFGGSAYTLSKEQNIPMNEAATLINNFFSSFYNLKKYFDAQKKFAILNGYSLTNNITRRKRFFPSWKEYRGFEIKKNAVHKELTKKYGDRHGTSLFFKEIKEGATDLAYYNRSSYKIRGDIEREAMNNGVQGTAADMLKTASILLAEKLDCLNLSSIRDIKPVNLVHDELLIEAKKEYAQTAKHLLETCMETASNYFLSELTVPVKGYISDVWKH